MKTLQSFGAYVTTNLARRNVPEDLNLQKHHRENRKTDRSLFSISYSPVVQKKEHVQTFQCGDRTERRDVGRG